MSMRARFSWTILAGCGLLGVTADASAYCRTTTTQEMSPTCPEPCDPNGIGLFWDTPEVVYTLNARGFPGMTPAVERRIFAQSFNAWQVVSCDGKSVGFNFSEDAETSTEQAVHHRRGTNKNVMAHLTLGEWQAAEHASSAFALTSVYFIEDSGLMLGADIEFNGGMPRFGECPDAGPCEDAGVTDLRNVATHEIGHFLGLGHSDASGSTMSCDARPGDTDKRSLALDDITGLCKAYPPGQSFVRQSTASSVEASDSGCSLLPGRSARGSQGLLSALAALTLLSRLSRKKKP
jgi:hypothetical protein